MAQPLQTGKQAVDLASASAAPRVSKIRRDPPPVVKEKIVDLEEHDQWTVTVGVLAFALAIFVIILGVGSYLGSSPAGHTIEVKVGD